MTKREAAIIAAYTGYLIGEFSEMHAYIEEKMGRSIWTHEMGSEDFMDNLRQLTKEDFVNITVE